MADRDRGFSVVKQSQLIMSGDLELDVELDEDKMPGQIGIRLPGEGGRIELCAEELERAAKVIAELRSAAGDYRSVCPTHGYFERKTFGSCEQCAKSDDGEKAAS